MVPAGTHYCYSVAGPVREVELADGTRRAVLPTRMCPYWKRNGHKSDQRDGYCRLLKVGDWMSRPHGTMLLWDQVKECGINMPDDQDDVHVDPGMKAFLEA